ncbi:extracellular solute-binding protein [Paenibacillus spongiae]|uniref:Extracellular solute-binding protein n=1 Tax=Paenibacillus spongiae TaxID=2909671 RepID=A0ABY5S3Z3_9BACL|nr:extracellular solute-binding protein [Paenibacillus spongiae]UVI27565.1 extracellular solute-binding protein [Paenibacillus spongiae]
MAQPVYAKPGTKPGFRVSKRMLWIAGTLVILIVGFLLLNRPTPKGTQFHSPVSMDTLEESHFSEESRMNNEIPYGRVLASYAKSNYSDYDGEPVSVAIQQFSASSGTVTKVNELGKEAVATDGLESWVEWTVDVPVSAMYQMDLEYLPLDGKKSSVQRSLLIDGKRPFEEASIFTFQRYWKETGELKFDNEGNQIRGVQEEVREWRIRPMEQTEKFYREPYRFYLEKGTHTVRLTDVREPMAIASLSLKKPVQLPDYASVQKTYEQKGYTDSDADVIHVQSEIPKEASELSLRAEWNDDYHSEPKSVMKTRYNVLGGGRWKTGGQTVSWEFEVPKDGLYEIAFRYATPVHNQVPHRTIRIDGEIPFQEMEEYAFPYIRGWHADSLMDKDNKPYKFYLTKGKHVISLTTTIGAIRQAITNINDSLGDISLLSSQVVKVTASSKDANGKITVDRNQDWNLERIIPDVKERLQTSIDVYEQSYEQLREVNGGIMPSFGQPLQTAISLYKGMLEDTETIPYKLNELGTVQGALGNAIESMKEQQLFVDYMVVAPSGTELPIVNSTFAQSMGSNLQRFVASFRDKDSIGIDGNDKVLKVWVARGREWVDIIKTLVLEDFTPRTGIKVEINTVPLASEHLLLLAYTGGKAPDVMLGVAQGIPVEFSIRGAIIDLNTFPDAKDVSKRFVDQSLVPLEYNEGLYALPETLDFSLLFYRTDVLERIGAEVPQTWQDVYTLLPKLQEEGMEFYYPAGVGGYTPFLFQNGGMFYTADGLKSALNEPQALTGFKNWTNLYNNYKLPLQADFYQRFRNGEMPIGVGNYDFYVRLATSAPELNGRWKMVPMPGVKNADGVIDRSASGSGSATTALMMESTKHKDEAWEFMKWWTSEEMQVRYGSEVESLLGVGSRWNSANLEAVKGMSWSREQLTAITDQWKWLKEQPVVLGGYYTARHLTNAWNKAVLLGKNERIALEDAVKEINKELVRKQDEFNVTHSGKQNSAGSKDQTAEGEQRP